MTRFLSASDENVLRNKIGMVLFALEKSVGDHLKTSFPDLASEVASSYFQDLLDLACKTFADTDKGEDFAVLKATVAAYDGCEIRNSVSHPNRGVTDNHWFRIAALASSPIVDKLQLTAVSEALAAAVEGALAVPPEHWFIRESRALANSLPSRSEHDATGFIGRRNDIKKLRAFVENRRSPAVAVVGPGGTGKTALALCVLSDLVHDSAVRNWCDGVVYISAKKEELTINGVRTLDVDASIKNIAEEVTSVAKDLGCAHHFTSDSGNLGGRLLVVCIDNFETVLAEDEDAIEKLNAVLPVSAKLILTSRVRVDGATTLPLGNLQEGDAIGLAGKYAERVVGTELPTKVKQTIASHLNGSPLAIKLAIDLYARNASIEAATQRARTDVIAFSFTNLIEQLTDTEISVVESLFLAEGPSRIGDLVSILNGDREEILQAVTGLSRTSLIVREHTDGGDTYSLNENIRGLVRKDPRHLRLRSELQKRIRDRASRIQRHDSIQKGHDFAVHDEYFVDTGLPVHVRHILVNAIPILKRKSLKLVGGWFELVDQTGGECSAYAVFHYYHARMLLLVGDITTAVKAFRQALEIQPSHIWARLYLAESLLHVADPGAKQQAVEELQAVGDAVGDWPEKENSRYWSLFYGALDRMEKYAQMSHLAADNAVKYKAKCLNLHLTNAGYAECKKVANLHGEQADEAKAGFENALQWLVRLPEAEHIVLRDTKRVLFIFKELAHYFDVGSRDLDVEWTYVQLQAVAQVSDFLFARGYLVDDVYDDCLELIEFFGNLPVGRENPAKSIGWAKHLWTLQEYNEAQLEAITRDGLVLARSLRKPDVGRAFFIATCVASGQTVLCHANNNFNGASELKRIRQNELVVLKLFIGPDGNPRASWWVRFSDWEAGGQSETASHDTETINA